MATKTMTYTSKGIIGDIMVAIDETLGASWVNRVSLYVPSNEETEYYSWFGGIPQMKEKGAGGEVAHAPRVFDWNIRNKKFRAAINVQLDWLRRDKTMQLQQKINELAMAGERHWDSLLSTLVLNGPSTACYDGQFFFDTDHSEHDSGTQDNDITTDISAVPAAVHGSTTAPSPEEMKSAIFKSIRTVYGFKDDFGQLINQSVRAFLVQVPMGLFEPAAEALVGQYVGAGAANVLANLQIDGSPLQITLSPNPLLTWTDSFAVYVDGGQALLRQEEVPPTPKAKAEGSDYEYDNDAWEFAVDAIRNAGYGRWQHAVYNTLV